MFISPGSGESSLASYTIEMGVIGNDAFFRVADNRAVDGEIHCYDVMGPEMTVALEGGVPAEKDSADMYFVYEILNL